MDLILAHVPSIRWAILSRLTFLLSLIGLLVACDSTSSSVAEFEPVSSEQRLLQMRVPLELAELGALDRNVLFAELALAYDITSEMVVADREGTSNTWSADLTVPTATPFSLTITWFDTADQQRLDLVTSTRTFDAFSTPGATSVTLDFNDGSSQAFDADNDTITNLTERQNGTSPFDASSPGVTAAPVGTDQPDTFVQIADCGSLPLSTTEPSFDTDNPLVIQPGTLHQGTVSRENSAFYNVTLPAGTYEFVLDAIAQQPSGSGTATTIVELDVQQLNESGEGIAGLMNIPVRDGRTRAASTITIAESETIRMRIAGEAAFPNDFVFGIFQQGQAIPSPHYTRCPVLIETDLSREVDFELSRGTENNIYLAFNVSEPANFRLDLTVSEIDGQDGVFADILFLDQFGETSQNIFEGSEITISDTAPSISGTFRFRATIPGTNWVRLRHDTSLSFLLYSVQATISLDQ